jgi:hypothetical protein
LADSVNSQAVAAIPVMPMTGTSRPAAICRAAETSMLVCGFDLDAPWKALESISSCLGHGKTDRKRWP